MRREGMDAYREPFLDPASREPIYRWPNELPIGSEPADTHELIKKTGEWLTRANVPKLHLYASPGAANPPEVAAWTAKNLKNIETVFIGQGVHFIQEDQPEAIGQAIADQQKEISNERIRSFSFFMEPLIIPINLGITPKACRQLCNRLAAKSFCEAKPTGYWPETIPKKSSPCSSSPTLKKPTGGTSPRPTKL